MLEAGTKDANPLTTLLYDKTIEFKTKIQFFDGNDGNISFSCNDFGQNSLCRICTVYQNFADFQNRFKILKARKNYRIKM